MDIQVYLNTLRQKGYLAYEYNPFYNYQTKEDLYLIDNKFLVPKGQAVNKNTGELLTKEGQNWKDKRNRVIDSSDVLEITGTTPIYAKAGSIIDLDTDKLNFDLKHPVDITIQPSYDGSVNLILNDNKNIPRLINSRFSVREKNTYEIVDRIGENDTNIYNSESFDKDSSLYFQYNLNPDVEYLGFVKGNLLVGQYCFYFTYCDADDNESDYIAETGLIPVFIGSDSDPFSIDGGIKNQNSNKGIKLRLENIDKSYNYFKIYYVRYFADYQQNRVYECKKIYQKYPINSKIQYIQITGNEEAEDIDANILNISKFNPKSILTQAQCKNMLFFGNIVKNIDNYKELQDCALRIIPRIVKSNLNNVSTNNYSTTSGEGYYNSQNIYNKTGYFNQEYYRFGIVFIYNNGTLSNVYNTLGYEISDNSSNIKYTGKIFEQSGFIYNRKYINIDDYGWIRNKSDFFDSNVSFLNAKGVCKLDIEYENDETILGIKFDIPQEVIDFLKNDLNIRGCFFVRQKCIPNILAQCYLIPMDEQLKAPVIEVEEDNKKINYYSESFISQRTNNDEGKLVTNDYSSRLIKYEKVPLTYGISKKAYAGICPDFLLNQPYYNQIFNGGKFKLNQITYNNKLKYKSNRIFVENSNKTYQKINTYNQVTICTVTEDVPSIVLQDKTFKLNVGKTEEVFQFEYAGYDSGTYNAGGSSDSAQQATNIVRGNYSPYLAIYSDYELNTGVLYNIYQDSKESQEQEYLNRMNSSEPFYAISNRYNFESFIYNDGIRTLTCWRGDCYINTFTYRLNRNFNDPSLPNNDKIIDEKTWKDNYDINDSSRWTNISRSDINAVQLGNWISFKLRSSMNYALRSVDHSFVSEEALMGSPRSYYPRSSLFAQGENKLPESYLFNDAYRATLGFKCYFTLNNINYLKDTFSNRIQYSSVAIQDSFKNNYKESLSTYFRDYSQEYGSIQKLVGFEGYLLVVFEHAIGIAVVNERILAGEGDGEPVFINTKNVLPEELTIITDTYGTQWPESVVKSEAGYVYGVDTVAKKIWRVKGQEIELLSDFKVNKFLVDNISLGERELHPVIGLKNVKTHYNNNKKDIMFTFYDDIYKDEEKVWNLCYNELLEEFVTFYSWIPSYSENIDTQFFTFNRDTSKKLTLLNKCNYSIPENIGILVENPVIKDENLNSNWRLNLYYYTPELIRIKTSEAQGYQTYKEDLRYEFKDVQFKLLKDHWHNYELFDIEYDKNNKTNKLKILKPIDNIKTAFYNQKVILLEVVPVIDDVDIVSDTIKSIYFKSETIALTLESILSNPNLTFEDSSVPNLTTDFYLHGQAGLIDIKETLRPTYWYGEYHPFEFEFVVNDKIGQQKIFENLVIISNKAEPESFHFEIEGDNYEFSNDKRTMYFRQEATKNLYQNLGSDMLYDRKFTDVIADKYTQEQYYRSNTSKYTDQYKNSDKVYPIYQTGLIQQVKSTIFPLYYERIDTYNEIYDKYTEMSGSGYDFKNLSGSEIKWNRDLNQFNIVTHIKNSPIDLVGRLRGNSRYKEGKWNIQIPSIIFNQKNENDEWIDIPEDLKDGPLKDISIKIPPIVVNSSNLPENLPDTDVSKYKLPNIYQRGEYWPESISNVDWTYRKEARIRDKWMKVKVRYSGKNLAVIHSLITLYNISYS